MVKPTDLSKLKYGFPIKPGVKVLKNPIKVMGFDSETNIDGRIIVLAASDGDYCLGEPLDDILDFLTQDKYQRTINFFYNLGFDHNAVFKSVLSVDGLRQMAGMSKTYCGEYCLEVIRGKMLKIRKRGRVWRFFDIASFYKGGVSGKLVDVYKATFGCEYVKRKDASAGFDCVDDDVITYCIEDARACGRLAENFVFPANRIVPIDKFYSGASLAKKVLQQNLAHKYSFKPNRLAQFAMNAYGGARIECFQRGGWGFKDNEKLYMYDIRSAYPSVQSKLKALVGRKLSHEPVYEPEALHSFFRINVKIDDAVVAPLKYRFKNVIFYPVGECADLWVDKNELELLMEYGIGFQIIEAEHDLSRTEEMPYAYLADLYDKRMIYKKSGNPEERQLDFPLKTALASSYGILIERNAKMSHKVGASDEELSDADTKTFNNDGVVDAYVPEWRAGTYFNPVHACEVTSAIRCKLYRDSERYQEHLVKFATDSMTFDRRISLDFGDELGQYEDSPAYNQAVVIGCGVYSMVSEGKKVNKFRSFDSHDIIALAQDNGDKPMVEIVKKSPVKLKESRRERFLFFNTFQEKTKKLNINFDCRRDWGRDLRDFNDLLDSQYDSRPMDFSNLYRGRASNERPLFPNMGEDLFDYRAYHDSTLNKSENREIIQQMLMPSAKDAHILYD